MDQLLLTLLLLLSALAIAGCGASPTAVLAAEDGSVVAVVTAGERGLRIENQDSVPRFFLAVEWRTSTMIDLFFGAEALDEWFRVEAGATGLLPRSRIVGWIPGADSVAVFSIRGVRSMPVPTNRSGRCGSPSDTSG